MVNFPPLLPVGSQTHTVQRNSLRRTIPSSGAEKREARPQDRRRMRDRRARRGSKQLMDRRNGPERRRSSIDLSV